jgi:replicative DNA helicase
MSNPTSEAPPAAHDPKATARLLPRADVLADFRADAEAANAARVSGKPRGPLSGFAALDRELGGAFAVGVHVLHGTPGAGKTAFALQVAASARCPALFVTCEMAPAELLRRHTARETANFLGRLKSGELSGADAEKLAREALDAAPLLAFADATREPAPMQFLTDAALIAKGDADRFLLVIDSLHSWAEGAFAGLTEYEALNVALASLRRLSHALKCPVLVVSERNRGAMESGGQNAGAGTRKIEYSSETVIDLKRAADAKSDGAGEVAITLTLNKNRHGATGKPLDFRFHGALQRFRECEK